MRVRRRGAVIRLEAILAPPIIPLVEIAKLLALRTFEAFVRAKGVALLALACSPVAIPVCLLHAEDTHVDECTVCLGGKVVQA